MTPPTFSFFWTTLILRPLRPTSTFSDPSGFLWVSKSVVALLSLYLTNHFVLFGLQLMSGLWTVKRPEWSHSDGQGSLPSPLRLRLTNRSKIGVVLDRSDMVGTSRDSDVFLQQQCAILAVPFVGLLATEQSKGRMLLPSRQHRLFSRTCVRLGHNPLTVLIPDYGMLRMGPSVAHGVFLGPRRL